MYLYGAGGHASVIIDILKANNIEVRAVIDDNPLLTSIDGLPVICPSLNISPLIISIGDNSIRKAIAEKYDVEYIHAGMLHKDFLQLKEKKQALYLFDYGGFFVAYDEDAVVITEIFKESFLDKTKTGYYITSLRSTINNNFSLKISELQKRGYEVIMVQNF